ncbi:MAG: hypothetical protein ACM3QZ_09115 [Solirubrobacterales bacterium]
MFGVLGTVGPWELVLLLVISLLILVPTFFLCFLPAILAKRDNKKIVLLGNIGLIIGTLPATGLAGKYGEIIIAGLWLALITYIIVKKPLQSSSLPPSVE